MKHSIELVVTDLDGTLWHRPETVPERTRRALRSFEGGAVPLLVATGRRVASTRTPLRELDVVPPAVVLNGSLGLDLASGERFHVGGFRPADAALVLGVFAAHDLVPCVYIDHDSPSVWVGPDPSTHPDHLASFADDVDTGDLAEIVAAEAVLAFSVLGVEEPVALAIGEALGGVGTPHVAPDRQYGGFSVTVAPPDGSKWDGILAFCRSRDIDPGAVLAIGDGPNDVEMLEHAAIAVVPSDAHPSALGLADHVIGTAADGGWGDVLDLL